MAGRYEDEGLFRIPMRPANRLDIAIILMNFAHNFFLSVTTMIRESLGVMVSHYHYKDYENEVWQEMSEELERLEGER